MRLLLVDDDEVLVQTLSKHLTAQHYAVDIALDGEDGWSFVQATSYDLIVLDVNLPKLNGLHLCQRLRQTGYQQPVLLLTAQGQDADKVAGLDAGADDYVVKPCTVEELCARIRALLRRQSASGTTVLEWGMLRLDPGRCEVTYQESLVPLSSKEYSLLELFLRQPQRVFSSSAILERLWGFEDAPSEETVRTLVKRLRHKLKAAGFEDAITTLYGQGYRLTPVPTRVPTCQSDDDAYSSSNQMCPRAVALAAWEQFKEPMLEQLAVIDQAVTRLQTDSLSQAQRHQAAQSAHKLAGSLGMFGFPAGSQLGREIEDWLHTPEETAELTHLMTLVANLHKELQVPPQALNLPKNEKNWVSLPPNQTLSLFVVTEDASFLRSLQVEESQGGIQVNGVSQIRDAKKAIAQQVPDAILLDLSCSPLFEDSLSFLEECSIQYPSLPILGITASNTVGDRLEIVRRCRCRFITKALTPNDILGSIRELVAINQLADTRVLIVDDDPMMLATLQQTLSRWGIHLFTLANPDQFWQTLTAISPDLLILDVEMPKINGIDLCQLVRSDHTWDKLPIMFLTAHQDPATIQQLLSVGGDDYLTKPCTESQIIARLGNRISRSRSFYSPAKPISIVNS